MDSGLVVLTIVPAINSRLLEAFDCDAVQLSTSPLAPCSSSSKSTAAATDDDDALPPSTGCAAALSPVVWPVRLVEQEQHSDANFGRVGLATLYVSKTEPDLWLWNTVAFFVLSFLACVSRAWQIIVSQKVIEWRNKKGTCLTAKNGIFEPFIYKNDHFAKTGSGQT
jgi:hypothetical protein